METKRPLTSEESAQIRALQQKCAEGTHYDLLGIHPLSKAELIENAYRDFARRWHPDRFFARDTGELSLVLDENFANATRAYQLLRQPNRRAEYDRELLASGRMPSTPPPQEGAHEIAFRAKSMPPPEPVAPPPPPRPKAPAAIQKIQAALAEQLGKAKQYYIQGKADFDAGNFTKAESALYLAVQFDSRNEEFKKLFEEAKRKANAVRARVFVQQADIAESNLRTKEAQQLLQKAVECDPVEGVAHFRLAKMLLAEEDERGAVAMIRKAVQKEPRNAEYRIALAQLYVAQGLSQNALREVQAVLEVDPKHEAARALQKSLRR